MFCAAKGLRIWRSVNSKSGANWKIRFLQIFQSQQALPRVPGSVLFGPIQHSLPGIQASQACCVFWEKGWERCCTPFISAAALQLLDRHLTNGNKTCETDIPVLQAKKSSVLTIKWPFQDPTCSQSLALCQLSKSEVKVARIMSDSLRPHRLYHP